MKSLKEIRLRAVRHQLIVLVSILIVLSWTAASPGQLGMGDSKGVAQQRLKPRLVRISGKLQHISTYPCENTTGKAELGTHLILKDKNGRELNIHLGPASEVSEIVKRLIVVNEFELIGFRTDKMPMNHYVAKTLILPNYIIHLRDSTLRPYWSSHRYSRQDPLISTSTTGEKKSIGTTDFFLCHPKYYQCRCF
jgi:hypothetical protein